MTIKIPGEEIAALLRLSLALSLCIVLKISKPFSTSAENSVNKTDEDEENISLKEDLLGHVNNNNNNKSQTTGYDHWSSRKKGAFWCFLILHICLNIWLLIGSLFRLLMVEEQQPLPLQDGLKVLQNNTATTSWSHPVIPPIHPHHTASVAYWTETSDDDFILYQRKITAPCQFGVLIFTVGPATDDLPYTYEFHIWSYDYDDNHGLCIFKPTYALHQTSKFSFRNEYVDPSEVVIEPLDQGNMHRISSRVYNPFASNKSFDPNIVGDYTIIGITDFYTPELVKVLESDIHSWQ